MVQNQRWSKSHATRSQWHNAYIYSIVHFCVEYKKRRNERREKKKRNKNARRKWIISLAWQMGKTQGKRKRNKKIFSSLNSILFQQDLTVVKFLMTNLFVRIAFTSRIISCRHFIVETPPPKKKRRTSFRCFLLWYFALNTSWFECIKCV